MCERLIGDCARARFFLPPSTFGARKWGWSARSHVRRVAATMPRCDSAVTAGERFAFTAVGQRARRNANLRAKWADTVSAIAYCDCCTIRRDITATPCVPLPATYCSASMVRDGETAGGMTLTMRRTIPGVGVSVACRVKPSSSINTLMALTAGKLLAASRISQSR
jgi:hypothetical protein